MFVDYNTNPPTTVCLPLEAHARGARVLHPDVVWDYSSGLHAVVVYESDFNGQQGIWSEAWQYNPGSPNLMTSYGSFGGMEPVQTFGGEVTPNIDADVSGRGMIVWEWGGDIYAKGMDMTSPSVISNLFRVSDCAGVTAREPDVSIRQIDRSESHLSFVYVTQLGGVDRVVAAMPTFTDVISLTGASAAGICGNPDYYHEIRVPIAYTSLHKPRVAMPWYLDGDNYFSIYPQRSNNTSVVYEIRDGANSYIASAQKWAYSSGGVQSGGPGGPWFVPFQTYSPPAIWPAGNGSTEWIGEILNADRDLSHPNFYPSPTYIFTPTPPSLTPPTHDLHTDVTQTPVCAYTGDVHITAAWDWRDLTSSASPRFGTDEILSRRIWLDWDDTNRFFASGNPIFTPSVTFWMIRPTPTSAEYFVVGDGGLNGTRQTKISIAADILATVYAFYDQDLQQIGFKLSPSSSTGAVRQAPPADILQARFQNHAENNPLVYPNPAKDILYIRGALPGSSISLLNAVGQQLLHLDVTQAETYQINTTGFATGLYFVTFTDVQGKVRYEKVVLQ